MLLNGNTLGERQKDLNFKVNDAVAQNVNFNVIRKQCEESDVDRLFKIDVAAKYKNTDYILEILKSGNSLLIFRALKKCDWLFDSEHSHIINVDYLQNNLFPHMTLKLRKKMLTTVSINLKDETEAETFYNYSKENNFDKLAKKFLLYTSEDFKLKLLKKINVNHSDLHFIKGDLKFFLGNSLTLAEVYLKKTNEYARDQLLVEMSYLYYICNEKYLDWLEKYFYHDFHILGSRITKDIARKHKHRILANLAIYIRKLELKNLIKNSKVEEVKQYANAKLPNTAKQFWRQRKSKEFKLILDAIPIKERFQFVKDIFTRKYPGEQFETCYEFYTSGCYSIMTKKQKIKATEDFETDKGNIRRIKRNIWYKNVPFGKAFSTCQENLPTITNRKAKINLLVLLIKACKSQENLAKVINHYYMDFKGLKAESKEKILDTIVNLPNGQALNLEADSWAVLQKLLLDETVRFVEKSYKSTVYLYYILQDKKVPAQLSSFLDNMGEYSSFTRGIKTLKDEQVSKVHRYLFQYHVNKLYDLENEDYDLDDDVKNQVKHHVDAVLFLMEGNMKKTKEDIPPIVQKYILSDYDKFRYHDILKDKRNDFMKRLKQDASTVKHFVTIQKNLEEDAYFTLIPLLRKLKIYFAHDIAKVFMKFFELCLIEYDENYLAEYRLINTAVIGIFMLADENYKTEFMLKYVPDTDKIDRYTDDSMDEFLLDVQEAICRFGYFSRPPLPISSVAMYLKGDYAMLCFPTIGSLFANLLPAPCLQLAQAVLSVPGTTLKYGFHLVLNRLSMKDLKEVVMTVWRTTENVSVRRNLYMMIYRNTTSNRKEKEMRMALFALLKEMTLELRETDNAMCFKFLDHEKSIPKDIKSDLLEAACESISKFRERISLKTKIIHCIQNNTSLVSKDCVRGIVLGILADHVQNITSVRNILNDEITDYESAKWDLVVTYLFDYLNEEMWANEDLALISDIMNKLIKENDWSNSYKVRDFISKILDKSSAIMWIRNSQANELLIMMLLCVIDSNSFEDKYLAIWDLKLAIISNEVIDFAYKKLSDNLDNQTIAQDIKYYFAKELGEFVRDLMKDNQYQKIVVPHIAKMVSDINSKMDSTLRLRKRLNLHCFYFTLFLVEGLVNFETTEIVLLALHILWQDIPDDLGSSKDCYRALFERIRSFESTEIQTFLNEKFSNNGIKKRRLE